MVGNIEITESHFDNCTMQNVTNLRQPSSFSAGIATPSPPAATEVALVQRTPE